MVVMDRSKAQIFEGVISVVVNAALFTAKFWVGMVTGSIALIADAWHTLSDSLTSIFIIFSVKLSSRKADKEHPFGHGRWELISSIFVAFVLGIIAYDFFINSIKRFDNKESVVFGTTAIVVTIVGILIKEAMAQFAFYLGRKTDNVIITADGWHHRSDSLSSVVVLAGIIVSKFAPQLWWMDSALGVFCAFAIFYAALKIMKDAITKLLGEDAKQDLIDKINSDIKNMCGDDLMIHHIHLHNYISQRELTFHIKLKNDLTIKEGHEVASRIEDMIKEKFDMETTIHVEPLE